MSIIIFVSILSRIPAGCDALVTMSLLPIVLSWSSPWQWSWV